MVSDPQEWDDALHRLRFVFGEYCFYNASFQAVELTTHITRLDDRLDEHTASLAPLLERHGAAAIPAHPISAAPAWLKITRDYLRYVPATGIHYFIETDGRFDEYLRKLAPKHRHELLRKRRRFAERDGEEIDVRVYRSPEEAGAFYRLACSVSRKTYQHRLLDAGLPPTAAFEAELLIQARRDAMRGYLLFYRGEAIAYAYGTAGSDCLRFRYIGYDPAYSDLSPGIVLLGEALRSAIDERRFAIIDFGSGAARYKRDFATGSLCSATVFLFRPKLRSLALVLAHHLCTAASDSCVMLLSAFGVKARIKRYFRVRRAPGLARTLP